MQSAKLDESPQLKTSLWPAAIKGPAGEAAKVLPGSQRCLRDGQAKGGSKPPRPRRRHAQL